MNRASTCSGQLAIASVSSGPGLVLKVLKKKKKVPISVLENKIRDSLGTFASREMGRRPMILPLVMEV